MIMAEIKTDKQIEQEQYQHTLDVVAWRCAYYRANPQRFVADFLCIKLTWFQSIILWAMFHKEYLMYLAARAQGGAKALNSLYGWEYNMERYSMSILIF